MKALEVFNFVTKQASQIDRGKKLSLYYLSEGDLDNIYSSSVAILQSLEFKDDVLFLHLDDLLKNELNISKTLEIKNGDIKKVDKTVSSDGTILSIKLYPSYPTKDINTHTKFLNKFLSDECFELLKEQGFVGTKDEYIGCLLYGFDATSIYTDSAEVPNEEYFSLLIEQMNQVSRHY